MNLDTLWQEALAATLTAATQGRSASLSGHASAKSELLFARSLGRLVGAFHIFGMLSGLQTVSKRFAVSNPNFVHFG